MGKVGKANRGGFLKHTDRGGHSSPWLCSPAKLRKSEKVRQSALYTPLRGQPGATNLRLLHIKIVRNQQEVANRHHSLSPSPRLGLWRGAAAGQWLGEQKSSKLGTAGTPSLSVICEGIPLHCASKIWFLGRTSEQATNFKFKRSIMPVFLENSGK